MSCCLNDWQDWLVMQEVIQDGECNARQDMACSIAGWSQASGILEQDRAAPVLSAQRYRWGFKWQLAWSRLGAEHISEVEIVSHSEGKDISLRLNSPSNVMVQLQLVVREREQGALNRIWVLKIVGAFSPFLASLMFSWRRFLLIQCWILGNHVLENGTNVTRCDDAQMN